MKSIKYPDKQANGYNRWNRMTPEEQADHIALMVERARIKRETSKKEKEELEAQVAQLKEELQKRLQ